MERALMSMSDVADLALVQRPVVSMWRKRPVVRGRETPFPTAVSRAGRQELFDARDVIAWLESTGRGNNRRPADDLALHVSGQEVAEDSALAAGLDALLALRAVTAQSLVGLAADEIIDLADEADPDDECLFSEVRALDDSLPAHAERVEALVDAAYGVPAAHHRMRQQRARRREPAVLAPEALALVGEVAAALVLDSATASARLFDATGQGSDLVAATIDSLGERVDARVVRAPAGTASRWDRRERLVRGWTEHDGPADVVLAALVGMQDSSPMGILDAVDEVQLELAPEARAVALGPAALLCDRLADRDLELRRDELLRLGRLRFAARLPRGLVPSRARESWGLWVFGPSAPVPARDRVLWTADLTGRGLAEVADALLADVVGATSESRGRSHAFSLARPQRVADLLATREPIVPSGSHVGPRAPLGPAEQVVRLRELVSVATAPQPDALAWGQLDLTPGRGDRPSIRSLGSLVDSRTVRLMQGTRPSGDVLLTKGPSGVRVISAAVLGGAEPVRVDPLDAQRAYPRSRRTEPGDVVFALSPARAVVDHEGFAVVASPARILRCTEDSGVVAEALARTINAQDPDSREWRTWPVPVVPADQAPALATALASIMRSADDLRRRLAALDSLSTHLVHGCATGAVEINLGSSDTDDQLAPTPEGP